MEIIIDQYHIGCLFANIGAIFTHSNANVGLFERHAIINAIASHANNVACSLQGLHNGQFVSRIYAIENADIVANFVQLMII